MKLKEKTTLVMGKLGNIINSYQKQKIEQEYLKVQLTKTLKKYWQFANNVEIVYGIMDHISWQLLANTFGTESEEYSKMMALYDESSLTLEQKEERAQLIEQAKANLAEALVDSVYKNKFDTHRHYLLKLNVLGVDTKLTTLVLNEKINMVQNLINLLQEIIDSFVYNNANSAIVGKFNARLKKFTKRLMDIVEYINNNYPDEEFELDANTDQNNFSNPIFNEDIITSDEGNTTKRYFVDLADANGEVGKDGVIDQNDIKIFKKIVKYFHKLTPENQNLLIKALDTNGDGVLDSDDIEWLENYVQDQEEIESLHEQGINPPYYDGTNNIGEDEQSIINDIINDTIDPINDGTSEGDEVHTTSASDYLYNNTEPTGDQPTGDQPTGDEPTGDQPTGDEPTGDQPTGDQPTGDQPTGDEPTGDQPTGDEPQENQTVNTEYTVNNSGDVQIYNI